jgi:hypothetical protein
MKKHVRAALLAAAAFAVVASTQAATYTGDLLIGFTSQSGNDFIFDLGQASALTSGQQFNLSSQLSGFNLNTVNWGIVGDKNVLGVRTAWTTTGGASPIPVNSTAAWGTLDTATKSIYQNFPVGGANDSFSIASTDDNSWNQQTINGSLTTQYHNAYENPNLVGTGTATLWNLVANGSPGSQFGSFTLGANGMVTFTAVPEPTTYGVLAGFGLLVLSLRRSFSQKSA